MDNGAFFFLIVLGPWLPVLVAIAAVVLFGVGFAIHALTGAVIDTIAETSRPRRERAYVRKHQRDITLL